MRSECEGGAWCVDVSCNDCAAITEHISLNHNNFLSYRSRYIFSQNDANYVFVQYKLMDPLLCITKIVSY